MKLTESYLLKQIGERYFLIPVGQAIIEGYKTIELNRTGFDIISCMLENTTIEKLVQDVACMYEATEDEIETIGRLVSEYVTKLLEINYLLIKD